MIKDLKILEDFLRNQLLSRGKSQNTVKSYRYDLEKLYKWLSLSGYTWQDLTPSIFENYIEQRYPNTAAPQTINRLVSSLRSLIQYMIEAELIDHDPLKKLATPKLQRKLPSPLSKQQIIALLNAPDIKSYQGIRDRAMMELMYASGLRVSELCNLTFDQIDLNNQILTIIGKGDKQRTVLFNETARNWLVYYINQIRSQLDSVSNFVFLSRQSLPMHRSSFWRSLKSYSTVANIPEKMLTPHKIRHAFATHLVHNGADLRVVQQLLGHASITTTQVYVHVANKYLKEMSNKFNPRKKKIY